MLEFNLPNLLHCRMNFAEHAKLKRQMSCCRRTLLGTLSACIIFVLNLRRVVLGNVRE